MLSRRRNYYHLTAKRLDPCLTIQHAYLGKQVGKLSPQGTCDLVQTARTTTAMGNLFPRVSTPIGTLDMAA